MSADASSASAYTSASLALRHTLDAAPAHTAAAKPARLSRVQRARVEPSSATAAAVATAESRLTRTANSSGQVSIAHTLPTITYSAVPGGCGIPSECTAAISSPESHQVTEG